MNIINLKNITVKFGSLIANNKININFKGGEIHTLLGENGAGKSTLISVLQGIIKPNEGKIIMNGETVNLSPKKSKDLGIYVVPQHFNIIGNSTVLDNIIASSLDTVKYILNRNENINNIRKILEKYKIQIDLKEHVSNLTAGQKQLVEIIRMLYRNSSVIILDEPTAILNKKEIDNLLKLLKKMKEEGKIIIFISHKLEEVMDISDVISVLRKGVLKTTFANKNISRENLVIAMSGKTKPIELIKKKTIKGQRVLTIKDLVVRGSNERKTLKGVDLFVDEGEIIGIASIDGNGEEELISSIMGMKKIQQGKVEFIGEDITNMDIKSRYKMGFAYVPTNTSEKSIAPNLSIFSNLLLNSLNNKEYYKFGFIFDYKKGKKIAKKITEDFDIRGVVSMKKLATQLSGGNLQKVVVGREMSTNSKLLVLSEPTKGLDVNAIRNIYSMVLQYKDNANSVILYSSEIQELVDVCDRIYVLKEGIISGVVQSEMSEEKIMELLV